MRVGGCKEAIVKEETNTPVHISILLDRSGSMEQIKDDIIGGFNQFLEEQRRETGQARLTLIQFDGQDPFEILTDGVTLGSVPKLDPSRYQPRGNTPLYDGIGRMVSRIDGVIASRADNGMPIEDQVVMIITDGLENSSVEQDRDSVWKMIDERRERTWTFVFLGANQDAYAEGNKLGVAAGSTQDWDADALGTKTMFNKLSKSTSEWRAMGPDKRRVKSNRYFEDDE